MNNRNITVIGIGRLGLCLALCLERAGYSVLGIDLSQDYIAQINAKTLSSPEPYVEEYLKASTRFIATTSLEEGLKHADLYFLVVPTNTVPDVEAYDHKILSSLLSKINDYALSNKHLAICSTVFPGYISKQARPLLTKCTNTSLSYNPEFIAQGDIIRGMSAPDMVLIGEGSKEAGDLLQTIYQSFCSNTPTIARMSVESAEITKLAVNCFITAKIAFANLIGDLAQETPGAHAADILKAVGADQRIGAKNLKPGYGFGGPCFPRDNRALGNYASLVGIDPLFFRSTDQTNAMHADYMARKLLQEQRDVYLFQDVCYKPGCSVPIIENSQVLAVAERIAHRGAKVIITDSNLVLEKVRQEYGDLFFYQSNQE
jgi:nucleotide sugar dehydrogenase